MQRRALLAVVVAAFPAFADVAPPNVRGCNGRTSGSACVTDFCNPGRCTELPNLRCPSSDFVACLACRRGDGGSCDEACRRTDAPCVTCFPDDVPRELGASGPDRWSGCALLKEGERCFTETCDAGACGYACEQPPCELTCVVPSAPSRLPLAVALAAVLALVAAVFFVRRAR